MLFYIPIILMVLATTCYHVAQKSVPAHVHPVSSLMLNYVVALVGTLLLVPLYPTGTTGPWSIRNVNAASCVVGVSIVGVELAVLLAYRLGWKVTNFFVIGNAASALILSVIGLAFFHEHLPGKNLIGIALCILGFILIAHR
jgi:drug/metabolite transporter (DMT)-like permease